MTGVIESEGGNVTVYRNVKIGKYGFTVPLDNIEAGVIITCHKCGEQATVRNNSLCFLTQTCVDCARELVAYHQQGPRAPRRKTRMERYRE